MTDLHILDLSGQTVTPINVQQTFSADLLLENEVTDEVCSTFPTPYDNDYQGGDPDNPDLTPTRFTPDKPVFASLADGTYALYDSRLLMQENSLENPLMDGGAVGVLRSTLRAQNEGLKTKQYPFSTDYFIINHKNNMLCANEQPNFVNFDHCVVSYEENVCVKEYVDTKDTWMDIALMLTFDDETLANFHNATAVNGIEKSRYIYAIDNLRWDESILGPNRTVVLPCDEGRNPVSRWKPRTDLDATSCTNALTSKSNAVFARALETSNDSNEHLRDIYLWNENSEDGCDAGDSNAYGMLVMTDEGCWENVHPDFM